MVWRSGKALLGPRPFSPPLAPGMLLRSSNLFFVPLVVRPCRPSILVLLHLFHTALAAAMSSASPG